MSGPGARRGWKYLGAMLGYLVLTILLSYVIPRSPALPSFLLWDKFLHFCQYLPAGLLFGLWLQADDRAHRLWRFAVIALLGVFAAGALDETIQSLFPFRDASLWDLLADVIGGMTGAMVARIRGLVTSRKASQSVSIDH
jgi:VanZ family protein